jgi:hypothetical protein
VLRAERVGPTEDRVEGADGHRVGPTDAGSEGGHRAPQEVAPRIPTGQVDRRTHGVLDLAPMGSARTAGLRNPGPKSARRSEPTDGPELVSIGRPREGKLAESLVDGQPVIDQCP